MDVSLGGIAAVLTALAALLTALKADKLYHALMRWRAARRANTLDATDIRKTTRVLLETIELKNQEMAMKDRIITRQDADIARMQDVLMQQRDVISRCMDRTEGRS